MIELNKLSEEVHFANVRKGFYDKKIEKGTQLMLIVSELAEALEADRNDKFADIEQFKILIDSGTHTFENLFQSKIKDTFEDEIADAMIRLFDLVGYLAIDIEKHIELKLKYNSTRPTKHGKSY